ncbi:MAG: kelch repeat-containing protein [Steroidobacteraceae bacterium]
MKGRSSKPRLTLGAAVRGVYLMTAVLALVACGGKGSSSNSSSYTVGGTISGLNAGSVVLTNGSATVTVAAGASTWVFPSSFAADSAYSVTVLTQPVGELCEVTSGGSGTTLTSDVDDVAVACSDYGQWIWEGGLNTVNAGGVYGTQGATSASNLPGARYSASSWTDSSGNFWLFGGVGYDLAGGAGYLNDLWQYSPSTGQWTWVSGGNGDNVSGVYGTQGTASAGNLPGARYSASTWIDSSGNLWLFGGYGYDSTGGAGYLNDLWRYSPSTGQWTWVSGGNADNAAGVYGTQGTASAGNLPGARYSASPWIDSSGNLWLFGGIGYGSTGVGNLNDLWRYSPSTGQWTWISGGNADNAAGVYGTQGTSSAGNLPGARQAANSWIDSSGNLWLFGGYGRDSTEDLGYLNDLWQYSPSTGLWTWISGGSGDNASGVYGTHGTASAGNVPGARQAASSWIDSSGNLWLFGGVGYDSGGGLGDLNDLWQYSPSSGLWTWVGGSNTPNAAGAYGTQGTVSASTVPGARYSASAWFDSSGNLWLFGGAGYGSTGNGYLNDLWQFLPP